MNMPAENIETENQLTTEQAADLAALNSMVHEEQAATAQAEEAAQEQASISQVDELTGIIYTAGNVLSVKFPSLGKVYTEQRSRQVAESLNPVFIKLGWNITGGDFAIYAGAIFAVAMLAKDTRDAIKADVADMQQKAHDDQMAASGLRPGEQA